MKQTHSLTLLDGILAGAQIMQTVSFNSDNDTLSATAVLQHKEGRVASGRFRWVIKDSGNFYISNQVGSELSPTPATINNAPVTLTSEALSLTWNSYNPWDLDQLNPASFTPVATPSFTNIQAIGVWLSATAGANPGLTNEYQGLQVTNLTAEAVGASAAVADNTPPVITLNGASSVTVALNAQKQIHAISAHEKEMDSPVRGVRFHPVMGWTEGFRNRLL